MNRTLRRQKTSGAPLFWATLLLVVCLVGALITAEAQKPQSNPQSAQFCWVGWTNPDIWAETAVNSTSLQEKNTLPLMKVESAAQLNTIRTTLTTNGLTATGTYDEIGSFDDTVGLYDDAFFADNALLVVYITENSGAIRHTYAGWDTDGTTGIVQIQSVSQDESFSDDMAGWLAMIPVARTELEKYTALTAVRVAE